MQTKITQIVESITCLSLEGQFEVIYGTGCSTARPFELQKYNRKNDNFRPKYRSVENAADCQRAEFVAYARLLLPLQPVAVVHQTVHRFRYLSDFQKCEMQTITRSLNFTRKYMVCVISICCCLFVWLRFKAGSAC